MGADMFRGIGHGLASVGSGIKGGVRAIDHQLPGGFAGAGRRILTGNMTEDGRPMKPPSQQQPEVAPPPTVSGDDNGVVNPPADAAYNAGVGTPPFVPTNNATPMWRRMMTQNPQAQAQSQPAQAIQQQRVNTNVQPVNPNWRNWRMFGGG